jgi:hypothetical protein
MEILISLKVDIVVSHIEKEDGWFKWIVGINLDELEKNI